ncbi:MAG: hypothetical protein ACYCSP_08455 [Acidobacteriaceae bacterium]
MIFRLAKTPLAVQAGGVFAVSCLGIHEDNKMPVRIHLSRSITLAAMLRDVENLRGICPWMLVDFRPPLRELPGIQDFYNRKGLISDQGQKKQAYFVMQKAYLQRTIGNAQ